MTQSTVEVQHTKIADGKREAERVLSEGKIVIPRFRADVVEGRWTAESRGERQLDGDTLRMVEAILEAALKTTGSTTQRNLYYTVRGGHPDWTYRGAELKEDKVYDSFTKELMEAVQLATNRTMQSLGIRAAPRGYVMGDGFIYTPQKGKVPLTALPALSFDLVDEGIAVVSAARKVIHFEKDAGFEGLAGRDNAVMLEAMYSTSQGYLVEAANKFLADRQNEGLNVYVVHDADPHGIQMQLMYGMSSKASCYMPSNFYPRPNSVVILGLFPRVAQKLGLPAESISETSRQIFPNLYKIVEEHKAMKPEVQIMYDENQQWEFQALSGLSPEAPLIYLVEALRAKGDEIKYVPEPSEVKDLIVGEVKEDLDGYIESELMSFVEDWFQKEGGLKEQIMNELKTLLEADINEWTDEARSQIESFEGENAAKFREAVKLELVANPKRYWRDAALSVVRKSLDMKFAIEAEPQVRLELGEAAVQKHVEVKPLQTAEKELGKDDIVESIEREMTRNIAREAGKSFGAVEKQLSRVISKIRSALEDVFGAPNQEW